MVRLARRLIYDWLAISAINELIPNVNVKEIFNRVKKKIALIVNSLLAVRAIFHNKCKFPPLK